MTGCLQIKNGKYYAVLSYYENGKRKRPWIPTGLTTKGNKRRAEQILRDKIHEYEIEAGAVRSDVLLSDYVRHWLTVVQRKVDPVTVEIFRAAKQAAQKNRRLFGREYQENAYVFKWPDGRPYSPDYVTDKFSSLLRKNGLPHIRFHELRHSCASLLINAGFNLKDIQEWMGHSDIKMTANIYGHLDVGRKQSMAENLSGSLLAQR